MLRPIQEILDQALCVLWSAEVTHDPNGDNSLWLTTIHNETSVERWLPIRRHPGNTLQQDLFLARSEADRQAGDAMFARAFQERAARCRREFPITLADGTLVWVHEDVQLTWLGENRWHLVGIFTDFTQRKETEAHLRHEAHHDPLTGLPNRAALFQTLCAHNGPAPRQLLFLDLDNFKAINDTLGHLIGDRVLIEVARRLRESVGEGGEVVRLGGDEFTVLLRAGTTRDQALALAEAIRQEIRKPLPVANSLMYRSPGAPDIDGTTTLYLSISIGLSEGCSNDSLRLLRNADIAMYVAKRRGRGKIATFDEAIEREIHERFELERDLRAAVERRELRLVYQPLVVLDSLGVIGLEGLARWSHPTRGEITPECFIPIAEESGCIVELSDYLFQLACTEYMHWRRIHPKLGFGVNVSIAQLQTPGYAQRVLETLDTFHIAPEQLVIEVTESILVGDSPLVLEQLWQLYDGGVALVLDDFGTGYSSLSLLGDLPLHGLKIDRTFFKRAVDLLPQRALKNQALVRAICSAGKALDLIVVAEGIETPEQLQLARRLGCQIGQGYLFHGPMEATDVPAYLARTPCATAAEVRAALDGEQRQVA